MGEALQSRTFLTGNFLFVLCCETASHSWDAPQTYCSWGWSCFWCRYYRCVPSLQTLCLFSWDRVSLCRSDCVDQAGASCMLRSQVGSFWTLDPVSHLYFFISLLKILFNCEEGDPALVKLNNTFMLSLPYFQHELWCFSMFRIEQSWYVIIQTDDMVQPLKALATEPADPSLIPQ